MLATTRMWIHEWSDITMRSAVTCCACHHARTCGSAFAAANSFSSCRLPRVGASTFIAAMASAGGRGVARAGWVRGSFIARNVQAEDDLPDLHACAASALGATPMLRAMQEHQLGIDEEHAAALDILLLLADARARWREYEGAVGLLNQAEDAGCMLSPEYRMKRRFWDAELATRQRARAL